jgi:EmrB/QacA subfamily drug resistance transporter
MLSVTCFARKPDYAESMQRQTRVLVVAIIVAFVAFLDGAVINVALPAIREELGGGLELQQWIVDGYLITLGAFILTAGSLSDSFGRLRIMRLGLYGFGIASIACALAPTGILLVLARFVQGAAGALLVPSALALLFANFSVKEQGKAVGTWTAWTTAAFLAGPVLGGLLVDYTNWRWIFGINVVPIVLALVLMRKLDALESPPHRAPVDYLGAVLGIVGLGGTVFALIEQERLGFTAPGVIIPLIVGLVSFCAFLVWEARSPAPMVPLGLFRIRNFGWGNVATFFIYGAFGVGGFILTVFVQEVGHYSATLAGLVSLPVGVLLIVLSRRFGMLASRFGARVFMTVGPLVVAAGYVYFRLTDLRVDYLTQLLPAVVLIGLGTAITVAPLTSATLGAVDSANAGIGSAINNAVSRIAGLIAVAFTGLIMGGAIDLTGFHRVTLVAAILLVLGGVASFIGIRRVASEPVVSATQSGSTD